LFLSREYCDSGGCDQSKSQQVINFFKQIPGLPTAGFAEHWTCGERLSVQVPFTDNSDKGDLRWTISKREQFVVPAHQRP